MIYFRRKTELSASLFLLNKIHYALVWTGPELKSV